MKEVELVEPHARAVINRRRSVSVVWIVPFLAAVVAAYLIYGRVQEGGERITIHFKDGSGLRPGQTPIRHRGVTVGEVRAVELSSDLQSVQVRVRLQRSASALAREGTVFWIVRPELGIGNISGLNTIISGPFIEAFPGKGPTRSTFEGADRSPAALEEKGLKLVLIAAHRGSLRAGSPVYYRGIEVGAVQEQRLSDDARRVEVNVFIRQPYGALVRSGTKFWNASGVNVDIGLFKGAQVNIESLKSLVSGGVSFATPEAAKENEPVKEGAIFPLYDEPKKEWLEWTPSIPLPERK
ncbi:MAG TPA: MlaD family protein [Verrucomicrobiae bacterium]|nr:MlaD family protein [Verrucomicrobiae bacterium]